MNSQCLASNPSSLKSRFTRRFLRALMRVNRKKPTSSSPREIHKRYKRIKIAAYVSMASAVGSRRAWSRAMLWKIRNQAQHTSLISNGIRKRGPEKKTKKKKKKKKSGEVEVGFGKAKELRKLVPGGEAMDLCSLLGETAHFIKCLTTQIQIMKNIADFCSD